MGSDIETDSLAAVANLVDTLRPPTIDLSVGETEDHAAMLAAITPTTLH